VPSIAELAVVAGALFVGSLLNALVGFGFALTTVPLMALAVGPREAVVLSAILGLLSNGGVSIRHRADVDRPILGRLFVGGLIGMPAGLALLLVLPERWIGVGIGVVVLAAVAVLAFGPEPSGVPAWADVLAGVGTGVLNTSVGVSGPPVVTALHGHQLPKATFRATASALFGANGVVAIVLFAVTGQVTGAVLATAAATVVAWPLGWWVGDRLHHRFPEERFRTLVLWLLATTAVVSLLGALRT
jgi:uncharacterized membrane protein YfcA